MAQTLSAQKRIRQSEDHRLRNKTAKSKMRTYIKKYESAIKVGDVELAETALKQSISLIYKAAGKGVIHKGQAARRASRLTQKFNALKANVANS